MGANNSIPVDDSKPEYSVELQLTCDVSIEELIQIAEDAGRAILEVYKEDSKWDVEIKGDNSPLTRADKEANELICTRLAMMAPHIPIISEENKITAYEIRKKFQYYWLVDPLDGTREFIKRNGQFTVNIALVSEGAPVLGVVSIPCQNRTYWAVKGNGAWRRENGDPKQQVQIRAREYDLSDSGLNIVASNTHMDSRTQEFINLFNEPKLVQCGSSIKLLMVAEGTADIYPRLAPTCEWDTAAADIIVREAGGLVLQAGKTTSKGEMLEDWREVLQKENVVVYNKEDLLNPFFVVFGHRRGVVAPKV
mmetsp:Transcript_34130/g.61542  ORF Transcript_34130/g.61542 Transcript_34130/m.61542 type:complete len:308 (-) Transcript_34130:348-1271(-)|eukprot:CAMPEP_0175073020 /NCGR_PEP_ID=MMETSP0052_2-20121109/20281_1 /TAXON_ID=51329 ORGANISM="Polytomella parva, Strain SAG 63-3" /NCGR_SAMPLE_ID=MMETSP0052_2 /ASSEMBLY_ACC=CAM_ASM_000194 /LENGTH=307 /DNA_ID=CAMNT_0016340685 /DNA_START=52 /DNA_END=975 /DNA_ORIENTATION=-